MADDRTPLVQQILYVAKAELEAEIPSNGVADDRRWEPVAVIERLRLHDVILAERDNAEGAPHDGQDQSLSLEEKQQLAAEYGKGGKGNTYLHDTGTFKNASERTAYTAWLRAKIATA